ncbi:asparagine synthetase B [Solitalea longa]|uniref:Asparagine synthetase B n=1 Tax=Solitalea longa TaxID=2079460 RepID=A0A2S4ZYM3_9SPHI|nr:asparagine synthetase B [Solitalea longa]POY35032.1 asparagine synthetase B [Solitalea longa]
MKKTLVTTLFIFICCCSFASSILIPMDENQKNHLKAYGIAYWVLSKQLTVDWLLNYRGGSFLIQNDSQIQNECRIRGVSFEVIPDVQVSAILKEISDPESNTDLVKLEKMPKIAVYSPKNKLPWDDAVTLVLTYAEIPYTTIYDEEVIKGELPKYDWLHMHHEDFTGQYGRFYAQFRMMPWYQQDVAIQEKTARSLGFKKVSEMKLAVAKTIRDFTAGGGFLFSMCSGTDSFDISLAAEGLDICESMFDGDPADPNANAKLDYSKTFAFKDFKLDMNPYNYEFADIDVPALRAVDEENDLFTLFDFSAKWDVVPTMLTQNHTKIIKGFMGQTTAFRKQMIKPEVLILGENKGLNEARYIHGEFGQGTWTFYGGHDPEDYRHQVGDPPTDLSLYPSSPGYRLILNNVLFPAAKKKKQKT